MGRAGAVVTARSPGRGAPALPCNRRDAPSGARPALDNISRPGVCRAGPVSTLGAPSKSPVPASWFPMGPKPQLVPSPARRPLSAYSGPGLFLAGPRPRPRVFLPGPMPRGTPGSPHRILFPGRPKGLLLRPGVPGTLKAW